MENKKIVGLTITTDILLDESNKEQISEMLVRIEEEIDHLLCNKFKAEVIGGKGGFLYADENNKIVK